MTDNAPDRRSRAALNTALEADFIAPLAAARGALEVLRDHADLSPAERQGFIDVALRACARLAHGIDALAATVYPDAEAPRPTRDPTERAFDARIAFLAELQVLDLDFSDYVFETAAMVDAFYDVIDARVEASGRKWHVIVNFRNCQVWPEAWVAFAHRGKKVNLNYALSSARYAADPKSGQAVEHAAGDDLLPTRDAALQAIKAQR